jgi:hypothetical protein
VAGPGCGEAFLDPSPRLQLAAPGRVPDVVRVLGARRTEEVDRPAVRHITKGVGTLGQ